MKTGVRPYLIRLMLTMVISVVVVTILNEGFYLLQREKNDRAPKTVELTIPAGTAQQLLNGGEGVRLPAEMVFVVGDILEVKNEDVVDHQLGPIWVPSGATGRLELKEPNQYSYTCSFTPGNYLGLDVRQATTLNTRLTALAVGAPSMAVFLFIYGLLVFPIKPAAKLTRSEAKP